MSYRNIVLQHIRVLIIVCFVIAAGSICAQDNKIERPPDLDKTAYAFISLLLQPDLALTEPMNYIEQTWQPTYIAMSLDMLSLNRRASVGHWMYKVLRNKTGQNFGNDLRSWFVWAWNQPEQRHEHYAQFKSYLYRLIDPLFAGYFDDQRQTDIRLDEVRWGGVAQDGIPPLRSPKMISVGEADYLEDGNVVFGIEINGDARAYPKRILAWHEMFIDEIGGTEFAGVYCTLCGAVILYQTNYRGVNHALGTSGFLYRSNKLMYDQKTQSLWSTTRGEPVIGPLVGQSIQLQRSYVVTTTWGEWRRRHPSSSVLSLDTGHSRNYDEGAAYRDYFATDELMFNVPKIDTRLNNKDEVLALIFPKHSDITLAIHAEFLADHPVYYDSVGPISLVVLTDTSGANRVYQSESTKFDSYDQDRLAVDSEGNQWVMTEDALTSTDGEKLDRLPAHRAFWFGWYAIHNETRLVQ
jgi:hypothetical protein